MDKLKFSICREVGCPHPRILDVFLTHGEVMQWAAFLEWFYREPDGSQ